MTQKAKIELHDINKTFRNDIFTHPEKALEQVNCSFKAGRATALLGHNGAGKTTSMRLILGLLKQDSGTILIDGTPMRREDRRRIGYMPETSKLPPDLCAEELLRFQLNLFKAPSSRQEERTTVGTTWEQIGLSSQHRLKKIRHLSKGMGRRLSWGLAIIHNPDLLILDEPFTGLDPLGRQDLSKWISDWVTKGGSVIMSTHELDLARRLCDDFVVLRTGRVAYSGDSKISDDRLLSFFAGAP
ncbi:MAG: ABC transporter ATP-binding protein [Deltaproteobacteria bacterium]|nr:ABC transporter ATP-binding protein [Deltaproteobacteria bacterium]